MDWQKIETAPKDPTQKEMLLGYVYPTGIRIMRYSGWGQGTGGFETLKVCDDGFAIWGEFPATHWMPLPKPPAI